MDEMVAGLSLIAVWRTGEEHPVEILVGKPREHEGSWECWVSMLWAGTSTVAGLDTRPRVTRGVDALQALTMGLRFVNQCLGQFIQYGGQLLYPEDRTSFLPECYFPTSK